DFNDAPPLHAVDPPVRQLSAWNWIFPNSVDMEFRPRHEPGMKPRRHAFRPASSWGTIAAEPVPPMAWPLHFSWPVPSRQSTIAARPESSFETPLTSGALPDVTPALTFPRPPIRPLRPPFSFPMPAISWPAGAIAAARPLASFCAPLYSLVSPPMILRAPPFTLSSWSARL